MIIIFRHAEAEHNINFWRVAGRQPKSKLTTRGKAQSQAITAALKRAGNEPVAIYHSGVTRTKEMAEIIAGGLSKKPRLVEDLRLLEMDQGQIVDRPKLLIVTNPIIFFQILLKRKDFAFKGGETFNEVADRMLAALKDIDKIDGTVLVCGHGMAMRCALAKFHGWSVWRIILTRVKNAQAVLWPPKT